ncbi:MAG TPA: cytochrome c biogenesis protein CcsA [Candidatus Dormibacteraeota bacterium]|nr:cytochrome c biogenesis protein CcsA [Candidatus Dormibacteraeota bacterium]
MKPNERAWGWTAIATAVVLGLSGYAIFFIAPREITMGQIQRIFYFHAASGMVAYLAFFISFLACIGYLASRQAEWDWMAVATAEVGLAFNTVVLITGPIWAKPVWGIWWTWDARLTLEFVLQLLYIAYILLRVMVGEPERRAVISAVFGIFAFLDVPLSYFSIRWWRTEHPQPVIGGGPGSGLNPTMWQVFLFSGIGLLALMAIMSRERYRLELLRHEFAELAAAEEDEEPAPAEAKGASR